MPITMSFLYFFVAPTDGLLYSKRNAAVNQNSLNLKRDDVCISEAKRSSKSKCFLFALFIKSIFVQSESSLFPTDPNKPISAYESRIVLTE